MGQRFTITESERNRIKGLYEQGLPKKQFQPQYSMIGKEVNLYRDPENKNIVMANKKIKSIVKDKYDSTGTSWRVELEGVSYTFQFKCDGDYLFQPHYNVKYYSTPLLADLKRQFCGKSSGGANVPKADYAQTSSAPSDMV
jgi:hypothetical protein